MGKHRAVRVALLPPRSQVGMSVPTPADAVAAINAMEAASLNPIEKARLLREVSVIVKQLLWTSEELLDKLCKNCLFSQDPELALHYYHGCSMDHDAWLYNNETLSNPITLKRVHDALEDPVGEAPMRVSISGVIKNSLCGSVVSTGSHTGNLASIPSQ